MKRLLLGILFSAFGFYAMGQSAMPKVEGKNGAVSVPFKPFNHRFNSQDQNQTKMETYSKWYNWNDAARSYGASYTRIINAFIFPDSTVKQIYGDGQGGTTLGYAGSSSVGEVFDPKSFYFGDTMTLGMYNYYTWDSLAFFYYYGRFNHDVTDTLVVQYYVSTPIASSSPVLRSTFQGSGEPTSFVRYNPSTHLGSGAVKEVRYELTDNDATDTGSTNPGVLILPVGINVPANQIVAYTVTFHPGYTYNFGDTLDWRWSNPVPSKMLNGFIPYTLQDQSKTQDESYNNGLKVITPVRYDFSTYRGNTNGWKGYYIPGDAWNNYNEYIYSSFHITSPNVGIKDLGNLNGDVNLYPNPVNGIAKLDFTLTKNDDVAVNISDVTGKVISSEVKGSMAAGKQTIDLNTQNLKPGVYFCTLNAGSGSKTIQFMVTK